MARTNHVFEQPVLDKPFQSIRAVLNDYKERNPHKIALFDLDQNKSVSWDQLHLWANLVARFLESQGIKKCDRIGLLADESLEKMIIWMGIWRLGAVVCPLNIEINADHIRELLGTIGPKLTLCHAGLDQQSLANGVSAAVIKFNNWRPDMKGDAASDEFFHRVAAFAPGEEVTDENGPDDLSCIFCTSGTTSRPKCVVYNHMAYWLNGLNTIDFLGLTANDRTLEYRSFGWNSAQVLSLMPWIVTGLSMFIAQRFSRSRFFDWIKTHELTFAAGVPTVINMLLNEPSGITATDIPSLRLMTCSTAPLSPEQWKQFEDMYGVTLLQLYGMSEAG
ncbi:long-chain fatty acid--CoA ligase, partial [Alphaproteobacteria bacterium]|nr:long-chain fatty acid--CoA ligase [Alphaproteobacteria bacterium]